MRVPVSTELALHECCGARTLRLIGESVLQSGRSLADFLVSLHLCVLPGDRVPDVAASLQRLGAAEFLLLMKLIWDLDEIENNILNCARLDERMMNFDTLLFGVLL